jgi:hypothetical protein
MQKRKTADRRLGDYSQVKPQNRFRKKLCMEKASYSNPLRLYKRFCEAARRLFQAESNPMH